MKFFANLALIGLFCLTAQGQTILPPEYPFNPDSDGDEFVAVSDVLMSVASYDNDFQASPIMVDSLTIEQAMQLMLQKLDSLLAGSSVTNPGDNGNPGTDPDGNTDTSDSTWTCGDPVMYWGFEYGTYAFGDQCWFQDNLRTPQYSNGDSITLVTTDPPFDLFNRHSEACFVPNILVNEQWSLNAYGMMYNWYAAVDPRNVCPTGWHVPSASEFQVILDAAYQDVLVPELVFDADLYPDIVGIVPPSNDGFLFAPSGIYTIDTSAPLILLSTYWSSTYSTSNPTSPELNESFNFQLLYNDGSYPSLPLIAAALWIEPSYAGAPVRCMKDSE